MSRRSYQCRSHCDVCKRRRAIDKLRPVSCDATGDTLIVCEDRWTCHLDRCWMPR